MLVILGLALLAGFNPKLLIVDLILAGNKEPRLMFACFLLGGIGLGLAFGLLDLFVLNFSALKTQNHASGGLDVVLGIPLLVVGALLATDHVHIRRRRHHPPPKDKPPSKLAVWAQRILREPRYGLAVLIGAVFGTPGAETILALHHVKKDNYPTVVAVLVVIVIVLLNWMLVIVPFVLLTVRPQSTDKTIEGAKAWLTSHARQIAAGMALVVGGYMVASGLVRMLS